MKFSYAEQLASLNRDDVEINLHRLPPYGAIFVFQNLGVFKAKFWLLTIISITASLLSFCSLLILSKIISDVQTLTFEQIYFWYCPLLIGTYAARECCHYVIRRYAESFSDNYTDYIQQIFYRTLLRRVTPHFLSSSKERMQTVINQYVAGASHFLGSWFWTLAPVMVETLLSFGVLYYQNRWVLLINLCFIALFLKLAILISRRFAPYAKTLSVTKIERGSTMQSLLQQSNTLVRFRSQDFLSWLLWPLTEKSWLAMEHLRLFHARRWFAQLGLLNLVYVATLFFAVYQVKLGILGVGFLALLRYAFDKVLQSIILVVEYVVQLTQEKQNSVLLATELRQLAHTERSVSKNSEPFESLRCQSLVVVANDPAQSRSFSLTVPEFQLQRGEHVTLRGSSGSGKTTFFMTLLGLTAVKSGTIVVNGKVNLTASLTIAYISPEEPFFTACLRDNLTLGKTVSEDKIRQILRLVSADDFITELSAVYGKPGVSFSYGQEQRLRLARGLLMDSDIYILDEAFSGLDATTRTTVRNNVYQHLKFKTILEASHDTRDTNPHSRILQVTNGRLEEITSNS